MEDERNMKDKEEMLRKIKEYNFSVIELALYLNTHPKDKKALYLHQKYSEELKELKDKYQRIYGPLTFYYPDDNNYWRWIDEPWPWEGGRR